MGLLYVNTNPTNGDPLAVCNDGTQGAAGDAFVPDTQRGPPLLADDDSHCYFAGAFYFAPGTTQMNEWVFYLQETAYKLRTSCSQP